MGISELNRNLKTYANKRASFTRQEWKKLRNVLKDTKNEVLSKLRGLGVNQWQVSNLNTVLMSLDETVARFDAQFKAGVRGSVMDAAQFTADNVDARAAAAGLTMPPMPLEIAPALETMLAVSPNLVGFFGKSMGDIITAEVSLGMVSGASAHEVTRNIINKFGLDSQQRKLFEAEKNNLLNDFRRGRISKKDLTKRLKPLNTKLRSGSLMSFARAERIATTEMLRTTSIIGNARDMEIMTANPSALKVWINAHLPTAREGHLEAEERYKADPIKGDEEYMVRSKFADPYEFGQYPRAFTFGAGNTVWCHCISQMITPELAGHAAEIGIL